MTIRELLRTVWVSRWVVLGVVVLVVAGALVYLDRQETTYASSAVVQLASTRSSGDDTTDVTVATTPADVTSPEVTRAAAEALADPVATVAGTVTGEYGSEDGQTIVVTAQAADPARSRVVADAVAAAYVARLGTLLDDQLTQLDDQRQTQREQLGPVDKRLDKDPEDPLAAAERTTIIDQYQALTVQMNTLRSLVTPGEVVQKAAPGTAEGLPRTAVIALALLAGLVVGVGVAFARRGVDNRVRDAHGAAEAAQSPVLAALADDRRADREFRDSGTLPVSSARATPFTESVRELRTAVQVATADRDHVLVVVTAADSLAPRSFIVANLAASYALSGRRTVVVSGDLRRPRLDALLPADPTWSGPDDEPRPTGVPNLSVFPLPAQDMDPADYLATDRARALLEGLRDRAEVVVVDAPPALAAADASILGQYATAVVLVATVGRTVRAVLAEAADRLRINDVPLAGVALAGVRDDRRMRYATTYGEAQPLWARRRGGRGTSPADGAPGEDATPEGGTTDGGAGGGATSAPAGASAAARQGTSKGASTGTSTGASTGARKGSPTGAPQAEAARPGRDGKATSDGRPPAIPPAVAPVRAGRR